MPNPLTAILKVRAKNIIRTCMNEGRLVFINEDKLRYTDKVGTKFEYSLSEMANAIIDKLGYRSELSTYLDFTDESIKAILIEEYQKYLMRTKQ